jgi:hypothetical protein
MAAEIVGVLFEDSLLHIVDQIILAYHHQRGCAANLLHPDLPV